jgi:hypothetical protein
VQTIGSEIFKEQKLTIGLDLGEHWSFSGIIIGEGPRLECEVRATKTRSRETHHWFLITGLWNLT